MAWPDFFIVGAQRAGTTSLHEILAAHPDVFMSAVKEPAYFAFAAGDPGYRLASGRRISFPFADRDRYLELFRAARGATRIGEASTLYFDAPGTPARIAAAVPDARIVVVLRDPVERARSAHRYMVRNGHEPLDLDAALDAEPERKAAGWSPDYRYAERGEYAAPLDAWLAAFPRERVHVALFEELRDRAGPPLAALAEFLGIDAAALPGRLPQANASGIPRTRGHAALRRFVTGPHPVKSWLRPLLPARVRRRLSTGAMHRLGRFGLEHGQPLSPHTRARLTARYLPERERLAARLGRSLDLWPVAGQGDVGRQRGAAEDEEAGQRHLEDR